MYMETQSPTQSQLHFIENWINTPFFHETVSLEIVIAFFVSFFGNWKLYNHSSSVRKNINSWNSISIEVKIT